MSKVWGILTAIDTEIAALKAERDQYKLWWEQSQAALAETQAEHTATVELLKELYAYAGGVSFERIDGQGIIPGMDRGTLGDVFKYLWPEGKAK